MSVVRNMETDGAAFFYAANRLMRQLLDYAEMGFPNDDEAVFATPARVMMQARRPHLGMLLRCRGEVSIQVVSQDQTRGLCLLLLACYESYV